MKNSFLQFTAPDGNYLLSGVILCPDSLKNYGKHYLNVVYFECSFVHHPEGVK